MKIQNVIVLILLWNGYFAFHSLLASLVVKQWMAQNLPEFAPFYRISFNIMATLLLIIPVGFMILNAGDLVWVWPSHLKWLANTLTITAGIFLLWTFRYYDMREFLGIKQSQERQHDIYDQETFKLSPMHRYIRHPWYFLSLVVIWSRDMDYMYLTAAITVSVYLFLGSKLEEKKLLIYHGDIYRRYCEKVPGVIPRPWRYLTKEQALQLQSSYPVRRVGKDSG